MKDKKLIIIVAAIVILVVGFFGIRMLLGNNTKEETLYSANAFFIKDDGKYALFSTKGKQLTDFVFTDVDDFFGHVTIVENENDQKAVINDKGKFVVEFGKYESIYQDGVFFTAYGAEEKAILDSSGKELKNITGSITNPSYQPYLYIVEVGNDVVYVMDYNGKVLDTLEESSSLLSSLYDSVDLTDDYNYAQLYYGKKYYIYDLKNGKKIYESEDDSYLYSSEDGKTLAINNDDKLKVFVNGKQTIEVHKKCSYGVEFDVKDVYTCRTYYNTVIFIDKKGNIIAEDVVSYFDAKNYVKKVKDGYEFYKNGKLVSDLDFNGYSVEDGKVDVAYVVKFGASDNSGFVNKDLKVMCEQTYYSAKNFDKNGISVVTVKDSGKSKYYLVNSKCDKVSEEYTSLSAITIEDFIIYEAKKDDVKYLLDNTGKVIESGYEDYSKLSENGLIAVEYDNKTVLYSADTKKKLFAIEASDLDYEDDYAYTSIDGKYNYYSLVTGKLIYRQK